MSKGVRHPNGWHARPTKVREDGLGYWQARFFTGGEPREVTTGLGWMTAEQAIARLAEMPTVERLKGLRKRLDPKWTDAELRAELGLTIPSRLREATIGHRLLYLMRSTKYVKVGVTTHLPDRVEDLQCGNPEKIVLIGTCHGDRLIEGTLHKVLREYHVRGEWFHFCDNVIALLKGALDHWRERQDDPSITCDHVFYCPRRHGQPERPGSFICQLERGHMGKCRQGTATPS